MIRCRMESSCSPSRVTARCGSPGRFFRVLVAITAAILGPWMTAPLADAQLQPGNYHEPSAAVTRLLPASQPPEPLLHARSGRVALLYREPVIALGRLSRPRLGLAGFRFDPVSGTSGVAPLVMRVEVLSASSPGAPPILLEHSGGPAPVRTYPHLLGNTVDDAVFEHAFTVGPARVSRDGRVERIPGSEGLIAGFEPSPDGGFAVVTRLQRPFSRLVPARRFPSSVEVWDLDAATRLYASRPVGFGLDDAEENADPRRAVWKPGPTRTLGFIEEGRDADGRRVQRRMAIRTPFTESPEEIARSTDPIQQFGRTTAGTPRFATAGETPNTIRAYVVLDGAVTLIWHGAARERYDSPGRVLREDGWSGPPLEVDGRIFLAGDGLGPSGPQPFLDVFDLRARETDRIFTADEGHVEPVLGVIDPAVPTFVTSRESERDPPQLFVRRAGERIPLGPPTAPFAELAQATRNVVRYTRPDGVALSGTPDLPRSYGEGQRLPGPGERAPRRFRDDRLARPDDRSERAHRKRALSVAG